MMEVPNNLDLLPESALSGDINDLVQEDLQQGEYLR